MAQNINGVTEIIEGKVFHFISDLNADISLCHQALAKFMAHCVNVQTQQQQQQKIKADMEAAKSLKEQPPKEVSDGPSNE